MQPDLFAAISSAGEQLVVAIGLLVLITAVGIGIENESPQISIDNLYALKIPARLITLPLTTVSLLARAYLAATVPRILETPQGTAHHRLFRRTEGAYVACGANDNTGQKNTKSHIANIKVFNHRCNQNIAILPLTIYTIKFGRLSRDKRPKASFNMCMNYFS
jgi:hypothetical protein